MSTLNKFSHPLLLLCLLHPCLTRTQPRVPTLYHMFTFLTEIKTRSDQVDTTIQPSSRENVQQSTHPPFVPKSTQITTPSSITYKHLLLFPNSTVDPCPSPGISHSNDPSKIPGDPDDHSGHSWQLTQRGRCKSLDKHPTSRVSSVLHSFVYLVLSTLRSSQPLLTSTLNFTYSYFPSYRTPTPCDFLTVSVTEPQQLLDFTNDLNPVISLTWLTSTYLNSSTSSTIIITVSDLILVLSFH